MSIPPAGYKLVKVNRGVEITPSKQSNATITMYTDEEQGEELVRYLPSGPA